MSNKLDFREIKRECEITFFKSSGPGGQHKNKTETAVRIKHAPTGIIVTATESRSQLRNRQLAFERLKTKASGSSPKKRR